MRPGKRTMSSLDSPIDAYIAKSASFAQPILERLRKVVHAACPNVEETLKWGMPHFLYEGRILCSMAAFKQHCTFGFWDGAAVVSKPADEQAMGSFGRIASLADLPSDAMLRRYIKQAVALRDSGQTPRRKKSSKKPPLKVPSYFKQALRTNQRALETFENLSPSHRREYVEWVSEAKQEATRERRLAQALTWLAEGKRRNWKYENC